MILIFFKEGIWLKINLKLNSFLFLFLKEKSYLSSGKNILRFLIYSFSIIFKIFISILYKFTLYNKVLQLNKKLYNSLLLIFKITSSINGTKK